MPPHAAPPPLLSVALSVYNGERHLREQLDSVLAQEEVRLEIVAVDDGSTDGSVALLHEYAARDPRIQVHVNPRNLGHLRSFERAMSLCSGDFIAPCDQDDIWHPQKLARLLAAIGDADLAYCDSEYIDGAGVPLHRRISEDLPMHAGLDPLRYVFQNTVSGHACLVRRKLLDRAGPAPALLYHDWWLAMCAAAHAGVVYVDEPLVRFRRHDSAFSPLGKKREATRRLGKQERRARDPGSANRKWIAERLYVSRMLGETDWRGSAAARDWFKALQLAVGGRSGIADAGDVARPHVGAAVGSAGLDQRAALLPALPTQDPAQQTRTGTVDAAVPRLSTHRRCLVQPRPNQRRGSSSLNARSALLRRRPGCRRPRHSGASHWRRGLSRMASRMSASSAVHVGQMPARVGGVRLGQIRARRDAALLVGGDVAVHRQHAAVAALIAVVIVAAAVEHPVAEVAVVAAVAEQRLRQAAAFAQQRRAQGQHVVLDDALQRRQFRQQRAAHRHRRAEHGGELAAAQQPALVDARSGVPRTHFAR